MPRVRAFVSASLATLSILASCASLPAASGKPIRIGWIGPLTGEMAIWGISELDAIKMEVESVNALGGIELGGRGRLLELVPADDRGDLNEALLAAGNLIRAEKVVAILGPNGSSRAGAVAMAAEAAGIPMVATLATNPKDVVDESGRVRRYVFRAAFADPYQGRAAAAYAYERLGLRRAAILEGAAYEYSAALARAFAAEFEARGGQVVADAAFLPEDADFREHFERFQEARPEIVYVPLFYPDAGPAAAQARELGLDVPFLGCDAWAASELPGLAEGALEGCRYTDVAHRDDPAYKAYNASYRERYGKDPEIFAYIGRDAFAMLVDAMRRSGSLEGKALARALESCDIAGLTGRLRVDAATHELLGPELAICEILGDSMVFVERYAVR